MKGQKPDVIIVGAGVIGSAVAFYLAKQKVQVLVIEKEEVGSQATRASAGMVAPFTRAEGPGAMLDLSLASLQLFPSLAQELKEETAIDIEFVPSGIMYVALSEADEIELRSCLEWQKGQGLKVSWLTSNEVLALEPALAPEVRGGILSEEEGYVHPLKLAQAFAQAAINRGASLRLGSKVTGIKCSGSRVTAVRLLDEELSAGHFILATGAWSGIWEEWLGCRLPVFPVRGLILALEQMPQVAQHIIYSGREGYVLPKPYGSVLVGTTQERVGFNLRLSVSGMNHILNFATRWVPALGQAHFLGAYTSFRPGTPDELPILGPLADWQALTLAGGHFRKGILLSPITGQLVSELLLEGRTTISLEPFSPNRFLS